MSHDSWSKLVSFPLHLGEARKHIPRTALCFEAADVSRLLFSWVFLTGSQSSHTTAFLDCPNVPPYPACYFSVWTSSCMYVWSRGKAIRKDRYPEGQPVRQGGSLPLFLWFSSSGPPLPPGFPGSSPVRWAWSEKTTCWRLPGFTDVGVQMWVCRLGLQTWVRRCWWVCGGSDGCPPLRTTYSWLTCSELWKHCGGSVGLRLALQLLCHITFCPLNGRVELERGKTL